MMCNLQICCHNIACWKPAISPFENAKSNLIWGVIAAPHGQVNLKRSCLCPSKFLSLLTLFDFQPLLPSDSVHWPLSHLQASPWLQTCPTCPLSFSSNLCAPSSSLTSITQVATGALGSHVLGNHVLFLSFPPGLLVLYTAHSCVCGKSFLTSNFHPSPPPISPRLPLPYLTIQLSTPLIASSILPPSF